MGGCQNKIIGETSSRPSPTWQLLFPHGSLCLAAAEGGRGKSQKPKTREPRPPTSAVLGRGERGRHDTILSTPPFPCPQPLLTRALKWKRRATSRGGGPAGGHASPRPQAWSAVSHLSGQRDLPQWPRASVGTQSPRLHGSSPRCSNSGLRNAGVAYQIKGSVSTPPWPRREKATRICWVGPWASFFDRYGPDERPRRRTALAFPRLRFRSRCGHVARGGSWARARSQS